MLLVEEVQADLQVLKGTALFNMYGATKTIELKEVGLLEVNKKELLKMEIDAQVNGIDIEYYNYYLSTDWGVIQMITFCGKETRKVNYEKMKDLNNGIELK